MEHITFCQSPPTPNKSPLSLLRGSKRKNVGDVAENGSYISVFVMINFAFKIGKSPLAAKRE